MLGKEKGVTRQCCRINESRENKVEKENGYTISKSNEENDNNQMTDEWSVIRALIKSYKTKCITGCIFG